MKFVYPIRDPKKIARIKDLLRGSGKIRDLALFHLGISSALRISDLLKIKVSDLFTADGDVKKSFILKEQKTNKTQKTHITPKVKVTLELYKTAYPKLLENPSNFIFFHSKKGIRGEFSINRIQTWILIKYWCESVGVTENCGNHTLRKTFGFHARKNGIPMELIQHKLNHSSMTITKRYLGITDTELEEACNRLDL